MRRSIYLVFGLALFLELGLCGGLASASGGPQWTSPVPVAAMNTAYDDKFPFLSFDGLTLYFTRGDGPGQDYTRIFRATRTDVSASFNDAEEIRTLTRSGERVSSAWVSADNLRMYYYQVDNGGRRLRISSRESVDDTWLPGEEIWELNQLGDIADPTLTEDELVIVFSGYQLAGGKGQWDLWMASRKDREQPFGEVTNLTSLNTEGIEIQSSISRDGLTLYFGAGPVGSQYAHQLFQATRFSRNEPFRLIEHLATLDTPNGRSACPAISPEGNALYFGARNNGADMDLYVSYLTGGYYVNALTGDDANGGNGPYIPFASILKAIDSAADGDVINVYPGVYHEQLAFRGKAITVQGIGGAAILESPDGTAVSFSSGEGPNTVLRNLVIAHSNVAIVTLDSSPTLTNLTIVGNRFGIEAYHDADPYISNCILWDNDVSDLYGCTATYSCIERGAFGAGNFSDDPLFFDASNGDYHLRSERGRYWPEHDVWVLDTMTSPCIDAGDPSSDFTWERQPNGGRVNVGAYGGTSRASLSFEPLPSQATHPNPSDGEALFTFYPTLSWTPGADATSHDVYFGTDWPPPFVGNQVECTFRPGTLATDTTYFWRIDERNNAGKTVGETWSFTTPIAKGRTCFVGATLVWVDGTLVPISQAGVGMSVCFPSDADGQGALTQSAVFGCVDKIQAHEGVFTCYDVVFETGNRLCVAENHYFQNATSERWVSLHALVPGMRLRTATGSVAVTSVTRRPVPYVGTVYNLAVPDSHQYLVGKDGVIARDY